jgi:nitrite reductase/ring-hydroxylating ferredoxin subunit
MPDETKPNESKLVALCAAAEVAPDAPIQVVVRGMTYAVFNLDGRFYVTQDACTHGPGSLAEGFVIGDEIECPFHQGRFHIPSGCATQAPCTEDLRVWTVHVANATLFIDPDQPRTAGTRCEHSNEHPPPLPME